MLSSIEKKRKTKMYILLHIVTAKFKILHF